jgi:GntR family transcriptional regulator
MLLYGMNAIFLELQKSIIAGRFAKGEKLPPAAELARQHKTSEAEVNKAIAELVYEGTLERVRPAPPDPVRVPGYALWGTLRGHHSITSEAKKRGATPGVEIIAWELVDAWPSIQERLALRPGDKVQIMERLRTVDGDPVAIETSYFPAKLYPGITPELFQDEGAAQSSFAVMEKKFGLVSEKAVDEVTVVCLEEREARYLRLDPGTPVLLRHRVTLSDKQIPIKASRAVWKFRAGYEMSLKK